MCKRVQLSEEWDTLNKDKVGIQRKILVTISPIIIFIARKTSSSLVYHICKHHYKSEDTKAIKVRDKAVFNFQDGTQGLTHFED